jgi:hypothetical protein
MPLRGPVRHGHAAAPGHLTVVELGASASTEVLRGTGAGMMSR